MGSDFVLGKYIQKDTPIHRIDSRVKVFVMILLMVAILIPYGTFLTTFIYDGFILLFVISLIFLSKIRMKEVFKSLKLIWLTLIFILIINILVPHGNMSIEEDPHFMIGTFPIYIASILQSIKIFIRIFIMILMTLILTSTTKSLDLAYAFEWYLYPLKYLKFPIAEFSFVFSLALRFIPLILEETNRLKKAQESRGVDFEKGNIFKKIKAFVSLIVPLLVSSYQTSIDMAEAMETRGFEPNKPRTRYQVHNFNGVDIFVTIFMVILCSGLFYVASQNLDLIKLMFGVSNSITILR